MLYVTVVVVLYTVTAIHCMEEDTIQISTNQGAIVGKILRTHGSRIFAFQGIPYAEAPEGDRRWKSPVSKASWPAILQATDYRRACPQHGEFLSFSQEDCLFLNVFTPSLNIQSGMPVMVYLHGGGFTEGSAAEFLPMSLADNLSKRGIVVVTINYRLGALGFFSTASSAAPGNLAFHDQLEALKWVSRNIAAYGGDPKAVTLVGQGAGAVSASILSLSSVTSGLFKRLILQSGSALSPGVVSTEGNTNASKALAALSGCSNSAEIDDKFASISFQRQLLNCLRNISSRQLIDLSQKVTARGYKWAAIQDNTFLTRMPEILIKNRRSYDAIIGVTKDEWGLEGLQMIQSPTSPRSIDSFTKEDVENGIEKTVAKVSSPENRKNLRNLANAVYVDSLATEVSGAGPFWFQRLITMKSEFLYAQPALREAKSLARTGSVVYLYRMDYLSPNAFRSPSFRWRGAVHTSEVPYIFGTPGSWDVFKGSGFSPSPLDMQMRDTFGTLWTDFVKTGNPTSSNTLSFNWLALSVNSSTDSVSNNFLALDDSTQMQDSFCTRCRSLITSTTSSDANVLRISARDQASRPEGPVEAASAPVRTSSSPSRCFSETVVIALGALLAIAFVLIVVLLIVIYSLKKASRKFSPPSLPGFRD